MSLDAERPRRKLWRRVSISVVVVLMVAAAVVVWQVRSGIVRPASRSEPNPSGRLLYSNVPEDAASKSALEVFNPMTRSSSKLFEGSFTAARWSPDSSSIAFIQQDGTRYSILVMRANGSSLVKIYEQSKTKGSTGPELISLAWSPDGSRIAYSGRTNSKARTTAIVNTDGTGNRVLPGHWESVSWSPEGERLLVTGWPDESKQFDVYTLRPDGSDVKRLTDDSLVERDATWSPDGSQIAFTKTIPEDGRSTYEQDIYVMNADGSDVHPVVQRPGLDGSPVWSPDGRWIAFASDRSAATEQQAANKAGKVFAGVSIYIVNADSSAVRPLIEGDNSSLYPLSWAP